MVAVWIALAMAISVALAELIHTTRVRRVARLAFGNIRRPARWVYSVPLLRILAAAALGWGLTTLMLIKPKVHDSAASSDTQPKHVVLVLDVSPSMRLQDAGRDGSQSRMQRASDIMDSFFKRVAIKQYRISVVAVYNGAKPVVIDTEDVEVVRSMMNLPMHFAFKVGKTDIFSGLEKAAEIAQSWEPNSTTVVLLSDGDTVPATGMPKMPDAVANVLVVGVGDPRTGKFIDGRQSRQDTSTLRQIATRLGGTFHNGNEKHLSTATLNRVAKSDETGLLDQLTRREYALIAILAGASIFALLPFCLHFAGTFWQPGLVPVSENWAGGGKRFTPNSRTDIV